MFNQAFYFDFKDCCDQTTRYCFPALSKQLAWVAAAGYAACHILNPSVEAIKFVAAKNVVPDGEEYRKDKEVPMSQIVRYLKNPTVNE